ncbi:hypothetical protein [Sansalvadorimonas verongulae]|uniref:hypothetical protein n=1 Tax=Sansalvadorimonas verongulae TaxID=2172824 RepID=UPI0018AD200F|nr:hypothetical protein [Sansalvadorimonas verongulae]
MIFQTLLFFLLIAALCSFAYSSSEGKFRKKYTRLVNEDPAAVRAGLGQPLTINFYASGQSPLKGLVPDPRTPLPDGQLEKDDWLARDCKEPGYLEEFSCLQARRSELEARGEEFCFPPLMTTLRNMCRFIDHIRAGKQFDERLTAKEHQALAWTRERACELKAAGAPYRRTVCLALALMSVYEVMTDRQVLGPLSATRPKVFAQHIHRVTGWSRHLEQGKQAAAGEALPVATLDPLKVAVEVSGGHQRAGGSEWSEPFDHYGLCRLWDSLYIYLGTQHLLLYPSFEELDIADFCLLSHLGIHPVGLMTRYALNADGFMMAPLGLACHDLWHVQQQEELGAPEYQSDTRVGSTLCRRDRRLGWRSLLLDQLPASLVSLHLEPALHLFLFQLIHECPARQAVTDYLEQGSGSFVRCLSRLAKARREDRNGYVKRYSGVTDSEAAMAALWALRLWRSWQAAGFRPLAADRLEAFAQEFVGKDLPRLQEHLDFVGQHRPALRQLFADLFGSQTNDDGHFQVSFTPDFKELLDMKLMFASCHSPSGLNNLDYTDIAYFAALRSPALCQKIADKLGTALPCREVFIIAPFGA